MKLKVHTLKEGVQSFEFEKDANGLSLESEIFRETITIKSDVEKRDNNVFVRTEVHTKIHSHCDRCLEEFSAELDDEFRLLYAPPDEFGMYEEDDSVRVLSPRTHEIDLTEGIREGLLLALPIKFVCSDSCKGLCPTCGVNLNFESCHCSPTGTDPRWEGLRKLLN